MLHVQSVWKLDGLPDFIVKVAIFIGYHKVDNTYIAYNKQRRELRRENTKIEKCKMRK